MHSTHLGIVFAGTVNCKSDNANPAAPGQTGANPGTDKIHRLPRRKFQPHRSGAGEHGELAQSAGQLRPLVQLGCIILQFNHDYNTMNFNANHVGRHMLCFVVNNHPSNVVVVDVFAQVPVPDRHSDHNDSTYINAAANDFFWRRHPCDNPVTRDERIPGILGWKLHRY